LVLRGTKVAAKAEEPDFSRLSGLAEHAHKLLQEFVGLPYSQTDRAAELLAELEHVIAEFKRLRPPPTFKAVHGLRLVPIEDSRLCSVCQRPVDLGKRNHIETDSAVYHSSCFNNSKRI
jgi:hypothetical protein